MAITPTRFGTPSISAWGRLRPRPTQVDMAAKMTFIPYVDFQPGLHAWRYLLIERLDWFMKPFINSLVVALVSATIAVLIGSMAGYALARYNFRNTNDTIVLAFIPLAYIGGIMGKFIAVMPKAVIAILVVSLLEALVYAHRAGLVVIGAAPGDRQLFQLSCRKIQLRDGSRLAAAMELVDGIAVG